MKSGVLLFFSRKILDYFKSVPCSFCSRSKHINSLPLILLQATVKPPVIRNMEKALWFQFVIGGLPLYAVTFVGYWAYGSSTSTYLLNSVNGPIWVKSVANIAAFFQTVVALHVLLLIQYLPLTFCFFFWDITKERKLYSLHSAYRLVYSSHHTSFVPLLLIAIDSLVHIYFHVFHYLNHLLLSSSREKLFVLAESC